MVKKYPWSISFYHSVIIVTKMEIINIQLFSFQDVDHRS
jgi:hypothetical protein